jgi:DNA repair protein RadC
VRETQPQYRLTIKELPVGERPQEKLKLRGEASLSNGELIAILLRTGLPGETVVDVAQRLLATHGGLLGLSRVNYRRPMQGAWAGRGQGRQAESLRRVGAAALARAPE